MVDPLALHTPCCLFFDLCNVQLSNKWMKPLCNFGSWKAMWPGHFLQDYFYLLCTIVGSFRFFSAKVFINIYASVALQKLCQQNCFVLWYSITVEKVKCPLRYTLVMATTALKFLNLNIWWHCQIHASSHTRFTRVMVHKQFISNLMYNA